MLQHDKDRQEALRLALANFDSAHKAYDAKITRLKHECLQVLEHYLSDEKKRDIEIQKVAAECITLIAAQDFLDSHFLTAALTLRFALRGFDLANMAEGLEAGTSQTDPASFEAAVAVAVHGLSLLAHMYTYRVIVLENFCGKLSSATMEETFKALGAELRNWGLEELAKALVSSAIPALAPLIEAMKVVDAARKRIVEAHGNYRGRGAEDSLFAFRRILREQKQTFETLFQSVTEGADVLVGMAEVTLGESRH